MPGGPTPETATPHSGVQNTPTDPLPMHLPPAQVYNPKAGCFFRRRLIDTCGEFGLSISIICKARNNVRGISMQVRALDARILTIPGKRNQAKTSHRVNSL